MSHFCSPNSTEISENPINLLLQISPKPAASEEQKSPRASKSLENLVVFSPKLSVADTPESAIDNRKKYCSHEELAFLNVSQLFAEDQRISNFGGSSTPDFATVLVDSSAATLIRSDSLENFADFSSFDDENSSKMARNPPVTLATVLENMPLVYNSYTKNLEKYRVAPTEEPLQEDLAGSDSSSPELEIRGNLVRSPISPKKPLLGHSGSSHSFTAGETYSPKDLKDEMSVPEISLMPGSPQSPTLNCGAAKGATAGLGQQTKPFKKGHVRHSSYETASITFQPLPLIAKEQNQSQPAPPPSSMNRTQSLHRTTDSLSSSVSIGSLSFYSDYSASAASIEAASGANVPREHDSALGDSASSKRSSLDRRSQCSALSGDWLEAESCQPGNPDQLLDNGAHSTTKRKGLALPSILPRGFFSRKTSAPGSGSSNSTSISAPWRIFSRGGGAAVPQTNSTAAGQSSGTKGAVSTTGLILEDRPSNLPAKSEAEATKHRQEYERMMELAKRKEQKDAKARKRAEEQKKRQEEQLAAACRIWTQDILPKWEEMRHSKRCRELWWQGLPPSVRGKIWRLAVGNELNLTLDMYESCSSRAKEKLAEAAQSRSSVKNNPSSSSPESPPGAVVEGAAPSTAGDRTSSVTIVAEDSLAETFRGQSSIGDNDTDNDSNLSAKNNGNNEENNGTTSQKPVGAAAGPETGFERVGSGWDFGTGSGWSIGDRGSLSGDMPPILEVEGTAMVNRESPFELIHLDVSRTFPNLGIFQQGGPYHDLLLNLLGAYVCYRPDVGYFQGMSYLAAILLLQMDASEAFVVFANLLNRPLQLAFFRLRQPEMTHYFIAYDQYFKQELPKLHAHMDQLDVRPDLYLIEWVYSLYAKSLPLDVTCRVWDVYLRDGEDFLFKTALGILRLHEDYLLSTDFDQCVQFLTHIPPESLCSPDLFRNIEPFMRSNGSSSGSGSNSSRRNFAQILVDCSGVLGGRSPLGGSSPTPATLAGAGGSGASLRPGHVRDYTQIR